MLRIEDSASALGSEGMLRSVRSRQYYSAMAGTHGPRLATYSTQLNPLDIVNVLGHDPRSDRRRFLNDQELSELYDYMQRKTSASRRESIKAYIEDRLFPGATLLGGFPAISIAVQHPVTSEEIDPGRHPGVVDMAIDTGAHNKRVALDGLGRISGVLSWVDLSLRGPLSPDERAELQQVLADISLPCVFYSPRPGQPPLTMEELGQLFHDFNFRVTPVSAKDAIALDLSDPYIRATYYLEANANCIQRFGMEKKAASLGSKSKAIVVQPVLLRFVRAAMEGSRFAEAARNVAIPNAKLTGRSDGVLLDPLADFLDTFSEAMGEQWRDRDSVHLSSAGWQALGIIYHDIAFRLKGVDRQQFARALATRIDWKRNAPIWADLVTEKPGKDGKPTLALLGAGASTRRAIVKKIRDEMQLTERLADLDEGSDQQ